jgi:glycosyltransferase involved in cell wall biosynthesis
MSRRVLLLSTSLGMGGADRQILYLAEALLSHGYDVRVVSMTPLGEMGQQAVRRGLPVSSLEMERGRADWGSFRRFVSILRTWKPEVLTSFMYHANLLGRVAGTWARVPLIVTSIRSERHGGAARDWLMRLTTWMDDCCTTNSQQVADSLQARRMFPARKSCVIPNGVDTAALHVSPEERQRLRHEIGAAPGDFLWVAVGRLLPQKDYPTLLRAFALLPQATSRLAIAGRGPLLSDLQQMSHDQGTTGRVQFLGVRDDVPRLLNAADAFVLSSAWEGMPNVVMEALTAAKPVVATRVGGLPELVDDGKSGFLVPSGEAAALAEAMGRVMSMPAQERDQMGMLGRHHVVSRYGLQFMADRWISLFGELLSTRGLPGSPPSGQPVRP